MLPHGLNYSDDIFDGYVIIALNSPVKSPQYNGGVEREQSIVKSAVNEVLLHSGIGKRWDQNTLKICSELAMHDLNHKRYRSIGQKTPCQVFCNRNLKKYDKRKRREIYALINNTNDRIISTMSDSRRCTFDAAWRKSVSFWMEKEGIITVSRKGKVLPYFFRKKSHK